MEKELKKKYVELKVIDQQIKQMHKQIQAIDSQLSEVATVNEALEDFENTKVGTEVLIPISSGIFAKAELKDNKNLVINVGAETAVRKTIPQAKKLMQEQIKEIESLKERLAQQIQQLVSNARKVEADMQQLAGKEK